MVSHSQVHVLRWSIPVMAKGLFPRAWVKKSFYFQVMNAYWSIIAPPRRRLAIKMTRRWLRACAGSGSPPCHTLTARRKHAQHRGCRDACQMAWWKYLRNACAQETLSRQSLYWSGTEAQNMCYTRGKNSNTCQEGCSDHSKRRSFEGFFAHIYQKKP